MAHTPRVMGALVGDITRQPSARTKYGLLFERVGQRFTLLGVHDATLRGAARYLNALQVIHPQRRVWQERFYQNVPAFIARSQRTTRAMSALRRQADVVLQEGVLFDARWNDGGLPTVIYTDYTATLAARKASLGRSPFNERERAAWIDLERRAFERAAHICVRGRFVREALIADYRLPPERVTAIGGGVNLPHLPARVERPLNAAPTALFIGKDFYRKGGDLVLRAFAQTRRQLPNARLLLLTAGPIPTDLPTAGVEWVAPTWERAAIETLYRRADVFVLPSRLETWGDVLLEAMAYGLPCLGVCGEAMDEIIAEGVTGAIVPPEDVDALATQLTMLLGNYDRRAAWGQAARQRVEATYLWAHVVERLAPCLAQALN